MSEAMINSLTPEEVVDKLGREAKRAASVLSRASTDTINNALDILAEAVVAPENVAAIMAANSKDLASAKQRGLNDAMIDRLALDEKRIAAMASGVKTVRDLDDPSGKILWEQNRPNGLKIQRVSCPLGVFGMIYESRPNVTIDASILCLKSHNAVILRGGSESLHSSLALHRIIQEALGDADLPRSCVSMVPTNDRAAVGAMLRASGYIDVMIPRGGRGLIERVMNEAKMPVFGHLEGLCHIYVHKSADPRVARDVTLNAKMRRTGICGAMETLLLDRDLDKGVAADVVANIIDAGCLVVGDEYVQSLDNRVGVAVPEDWKTEYLDAKLSARIINGVEDAVSYINGNGSHHTDCIIAQDDEAVSYFRQNVDSGIVMSNASTQFADGGEFGMGAEIGIATGKMHARGPVGLEQLCTYKYIVHGTGQTRP